MTAHERARELAAIAVDFELDAGERAELDLHLEACEVCPPFVAALSGDGVALAALPRVDAPDRVRRAVLAGRPARQSASAGPLAAAAIVLVLALVPLGAGALLFGGFGSSGAGATTAPMVTPGAMTAAPTMAPATQGPTPGVSPSPSPSPSTSPSPSAPATPGPT